MMSARQALPATIPVSVVIGTFDRPVELRDLLRSLVAQETDRAVEIIVVDNNPSSGMTAGVVSLFAGVHLLREERRGVACARNAGILASSGEIIVTVDDDVTMPRDWLEKLLAPFNRGDCMAVTGNVLPDELETEAARLFEAYGGLGRGFEPFEFNREWFESFKLRAVPTWKIGGTANAAFRRCIFSNPRIGLMNELLGSGMPAGVGEDTYLFYKILKAGCTIIYEPSAVVRHKHRRRLDVLYRQIYDYSKGHVAYHLLTLIQDRDLRALTRLAASLPLTHLARALGRLAQRGQRRMLRLTLVEVAGNLAGPWALWRSYSQSLGNTHTQQQQPQGVSLRPSAASSVNKEVL